jgi:hypothetical protein
MPPVHLYVMDLGHTDFTIDSYDRLGRDAVYSGI